MRTRMISALAAVVVVACAGGSIAAPVSGQGTWETTLQARDLDGDGVADAFYDTVIKATWMRDTRSTPRMDWYAALNWAANLSVGGIGGWRLPTMIDTDQPGCGFTFTGGTDCGVNVQTISPDGLTVYSEMADLWYETLGNKTFCQPGDPLCTPGVVQAGAGLTNTANFLGLEGGGAYWTGLAYGFGTNGVWTFGTGMGLQNIDPSQVLLGVMAVHPGDVGASLVPEPKSLVLVVTAIAGLTITRRRGRN